MPKEDINTGMIIAEKVSDHLPFQNQKQFDNKSKKAISIEKKYTHKKRNRLGTYFKVIKGKIIYKCPYENCIKLFKEKGNLKTHVRIHTGERPYICHFENCNKAFITIGNLKSHVCKHTGIKPYKCKYENCRKSYTRLCRFKIHLRTHSGFKPYKCCHPDCNKTFNEKGNLRTHERIHTGEKPYKCTFDLCDKSFKAHGHLKDHIKRHLNIKPFACDLCEMKFTRNSTLKIHKYVHTGEKPCKCDFPGCGKRFAEKGNLRTHYKIHLKSPKKIEIAEKNGKFPMNEHINYNYRNTNLNNNDSKNQNNNHSFSDITTIDCKIESNNNLKFKNGPFEISSLNLGNEIVVESQEKQECKIFNFNNRPKSQPNTIYNSNENEDILISNKYSTDLIPIKIDKENFQIQLKNQEHISGNLNKNSYYSDDSYSSFEKDELILQLHYKNNHIKTKIENQLLKDTNNKQSENLFKCNNNLNLINQNLDNLHNGANLSNLYQNFENYRNQFFLNFQTNNFSNSKFNLNDFLSKNQAIDHLNYLHSNSLVKLVFPNTPNNLTLSNYKLILPNFYQQ